MLKKKNSHLSFLHCYHHFFMVVGTYIAVRWIPGGHGLLLGFVNLFVHAFMYFYYFLNAVKPELKQSLWWKKHITQIQMVNMTASWVQKPLINMVFQFQFAFLDIAFFYATFFDCGYPKFWLWVLVIQNTFMFALFADFYRRAYFKKAKIHWCINKFRNCSLKRFVYDFTAIIVGCIFGLACEGCVSGWTCTYWI